MTQEATERTVEERMLDAGFVKEEKARSPRQRLLRKWGYVPPPPSHPDAAKWTRYGLTPPVSSS